MCSLNSQTWDQDVNWDQELDVHPGASRMAKILKIENDKLGKG